MRVVAKEAAGHPHPRDGDRTGALQPGDQVEQQPQRGMLVGDGKGG
jgi:hypothetical protein